ncbi:hypothetical protein GETHLI_12640 [Geothrix limicola]|uniref:Lipoprotein n=1 Tax=Geothrix limicola TaxID=2927978 RepID=A0ABQ5QDM3_9BACT|nr:hypothetical protein [Geothrix limicola]GLH72762.1 hypothetical protein GETHLI_12640 [Geothrix limicola]
MRNRTLFSFLSCAALVLLVACGGGSSKPAPKPVTSASKLVYTDPTSGDYRLVKDSSSTDTHLVLNLMGPSTGTLGRGVAFYLNTDSALVTWSKVASADAEFAQGPLFTDKLKTKVTGGELQVGSFQKGRGAAAANIGATTVLAHVALDLKTGTTPGAVSLASPADKAVLIPDTGDALTPIAITAGTLLAQ